MMKLFYFISLLFFTLTAHSNEKDGWKHESEVGIVVTTGNTDTQTYAAKQKTDYDWNQNTLIFSSNYLFAESNDIMSARRWGLGLRYEYALTDKFSLFTGYGIESDVFSKIDLSHIINLGGKYYFIKNEKDEFLNETGYRFVREQRTTGVDKSLHYARVYFEWKRKWSESVSHQIGAEYLPNFTETRDYEIKGDAALQVMLSQILALKLSYGVKYDNEPAVAGLKKVDSTYLTSLAVKF